MKNIVRKVVAVIAAIVLVFSCYQIYKYYSEEWKQQSIFDDLYASVKKYALPKISFKEKYNELLKKNPDMVGWVKIDGTNINYPVMQDKKAPEFYLKHNFKKEYSVYGVPFVPAECDLVSSDNVIVYGHHMKDGKMFAALEGYKSNDFYKAHSIINFETNTASDKYEIIAAFRTTPDKFKYHEFINVTDKKTFDEFVAKCKSIQFYDTGKTAKYGEKLLTLSTCEYSEQDSRMVVLAKKIGNN